MMGREFEREKGNDRARAGSGNKGWEKRAGGALSVQRSKSVGELFEWHNRKKTILRA
jgi:hypothetical protein